MTDSESPSTNGPGRGNEPGLVISRRTLRRVGVGVIVLAVAGVAYGIGRATTSTGHSHVKAAVSVQPRAPRRDTAATTTTTPQPATTAAPDTTTAPATSSTTALTTPTTAVPVTTAQALPTVTMGGAFGEAAYVGRFPTSIGISNDGTNVIVDLTWATWNQQDAVGHGTWHYLSCNPDCAGGTSTPYPATITLSNVVDGRYTELTEQTSGPESSTQSEPLPSGVAGAS